MNSSRVSLPLEFNFQSMKIGEAVEVGDEENKLFVACMVVFVFVFVFMFMFMFMLILLCVRVSSFVLCVCSLYTLVLYYCIISNSYDCTMTVVVIAVL